MSFDRRYFSRQLSLDGFGPLAQRRLAGSRALVAGLGGTGSVVATQLALAGVGHLTLVDRDVVSTENLHRQPIYSLADVGMAKAEAAAAFLRERVPGVKIEFDVDSLDDLNSHRVLGRADLAADCLDNLPSRLALNRACVEKGIPLVHTGATGWDASSGTFWAPRSACLECLFPAGTHDPVPSCEEAGALASITSESGSAGSLEAIKILAGLPPSLIGKVVFFDGRTGESRTVAVAKRPDCGACGRSPSPPKEYAPIQLCGGSEFYVARAFEPRSFTKVVRSLGGGRLLGDSVAMVRVGALSISLFKSGGVLVKGASSREEVQRALAALVLARTRQKLRPSRPGNT